MLITQQIWLESVKLFRSHTETDGWTEITNSLTHFKKHGGPYDEDGSAGINFIKANKHGNPYLII